MLPALVPRERCSGRPPDRLDGGHDVLIGPAAADVAAHELLHVRVVRAARLLEQRDGRHDLARRAVAALIRVASYERRLHGMQRLGRAEDRKSTRLNSSHSQISY